MDFVVFSEENTNLNSEDENEQKGKEGWEQRTCTAVLVSDSGELFL